MIPPAWLDELDARNRDNATRTASYLELYGHLRRGGVDLPWVLMAHLVSRNAGYLLTDLARSAATADAALAGAMRTLAALLERGNFLIFLDAWHHLGHHLLGRTDQLAPPRTPRFMIDAWRRHEASANVDERALVLDLVHNEQHLIEHRVVHHPDLAAGARLVALIEASGREKPLHFPLADAPAITVGGFADVARRIAAGRRIYDEVLVDRGRRDALWAWCLAHPHTGSRAVYGGRPGPDVRDAWPVATLRAVWPGVHAPMEPDPRYP